jgi:hypothetical protein
MGRLTCSSCKALLPRRGARCRNCGWAADYGTGFNRRDREVLVGVGLMVVGLSMALAIVAIAYLGPP